MHHTKYTFHKSKAVGLAKTFTRIITVEIVEIFQNKNILHFSDAKKIPGYMIDAFVSPGDPGAFANYSWCWKGRLFQPFVSTSLGRKEWYKTLGQRAYSGGIFEAMSILGLEACLLYNIFWRGTAKGIWAVEGALEGKGAKIGSFSFWNGWLSTFTFLPGFLTFSEGAFWHSYSESEKHHCNLWIVLRHASGICCRYALLPMSTSLASSSLAFRWSCSQIKDFWIFQWCALGQLPSTSRSCQRVWSSCPRFTFGKEVEACLRRFSHVLWSHSCLRVHGADWTGNHAWPQWVADQDKAPRNFALSRLLWIRCVITFVEHQWNSSKPQCHRAWCTKICWRTVWSSKSNSGWTKIWLFLPSFSRKLGSRCQCYDSSPGSHELVLTYRHIAMWVVVLGRSKVWLAIGSSFKCPKYHETSTWWLKGVWIICENTEVFREYHLWVIRVYIYHENLGVLNGWVEIILSQFARRRIHNFSNRPFDLLMISWINGFMSLTWTNRSYMHLKRLMFEVGFKMDLWYEVVGTFTQSFRTSG